MGRLTDNEIDYNLTTLKGWALDENESRIIKGFIFKDFKEAIAAMVKIGEVAEELNHHPDWTNVYNTLTISLSTHDANGVTEKDFKLAEAIEGIVEVEE